MGLVSERIEGPDCSRLAWFRGGDVVGIKIILGEIGAKAMRFLN